MWENDAYRQGWYAGYDDKVAGPNPYPKDTDDYKMWEMGFTHGWQDAIEAWGFE